MAFSISVPKIAGSTSLQSRRAAVASRPIMSASQGSGSGGPSGPGAKMPPLKRRTSARRALTKPPAFIPRHSSPTSGRKLGGFSRVSSSSSVKLSRRGSRPTDCANIVKTQRMRKVETASGVWPFASSAFESFASHSAMSRVTSTRRRAGSSESGSSHTARSRARIAGSRRSSR